MLHVTSSVFMYELTSGQSQWSKEACRKHLAAGLYFREANSANPDVPTSKMNNILEIRSHFSKLYKYKTNLG